jgi:hypothetical protein
MNTVYQSDPSIVSFSTMYLKPSDNINKTYTAGKSRANILTEITPKKTHGHQSTNVWFKQTLFKQ